MTPLTTSTPSYIISPAFILRYRCAHGRTYQHAQYPPTLLSPRSLHPLFCSPPHPSSRSWCWIQVHPATAHAFQGSPTSCQAVLQSFSVHHAAFFHCGMQNATVVVRGRYSPSSQPIHPYLPQPLVAMLCRPCPSPDFVSWEGSCPWTQSNTVSDVSGAAVIHVFFDFRALVSSPADLDGTQKTTLHSQNLLGRCAGHGRGQPTLLLLFRQQHTSRKKIICPRCMGATRRLSMGKTLSPLRCIKRFL